MLTSMGTQLKFVPVLCRLSQLSLISVRQLTRSRPLVSCSAECLSDSRAHRHRQHDSCHHGHASNGPSTPNARSVLRPFDNAKHLVSHRQFSQLCVLRPNLRPAIEGSRHFHALARRSLENNIHYCVKRCKSKRPIADDEEVINFV